MLMLCDKVGTSTPHRITHTKEVEMRSLTITRRIGLAHTPTEALPSTVYVCEQGADSSARPQRRADGRTNAAPP